jgi:anti-sigma-K factor RskA
MTPFEEQLRKAMARREPSRDFAARVLEKARQESTSGNRKNRSWLERLSFWRLIPVMAAFLLMTGGVVYQEHERAIRGEQAKEKLLIAMRIAGSKLRVARDHVISYEARGAVEQ